MKNSRKLLFSKFEKSKFSGIAHVKGGEGEKTKITGGSGTTWDKSKAGQTHDDIYDTTKANDSWTTNEGSTGNGF